LHFLGSGLENTSAADSPTYQLTNSLGPKSATNAEFHIRALYSEGTGYVPNFVPNFGDPMRTNVPALRAAA